VLVADHRSPQLQFQACLKAGDRASDRQVQTADPALAVTVSTARHWNRQDLIALVTHWLWQPYVLSPEQKNIASFEVETLQRNAVPAAAADHTRRFGETVFKSSEIAVN
jgi:hypothetical protein